MTTGTINELKALILSIRKEMATNVIIQRDIMKTRFELKADVVQGKLTEDEAQRQLQGFAPGHLGMRPKDADKKMVDRMLDWALSLDEVRDLQHKVDIRRPRLQGDMSALQLDTTWAKRLSKAWPGRFTTVDDFVGLVMPALEMVSAMGQTATPVQKVRLWVEAVLEASHLIGTHLSVCDPDAQGQGLGGDDLPSLVLFLTAMADCEHVVAQATLASCFAVDEYDKDEFDLPFPAGLYSEVSDQYLFNAESRLVDPAHYFFWVNDALQVIAGLPDDERSPRSTPRSRSSSLTMEGLSDPPPRRTNSNTMPSPIIEGEEPDPEPTTSSNPADPPPPPYSERAPPSADEEGESESPASPGLQDSIDRLAALQVETAQHIAELEGDSVSPRGLFNEPLPLEAEMGLTAVASGDISPPDPPTPPSPAAASDAVPTDGELIMGDDGSDPVLALQRMGSMQDYAAGVQCLQAGDMSPPDPDTPVYEPSSRGRGARSAANEEDLEWALSQAKDSNQSDVVAEIADPLNEDVSPGADTGRSRASSGYSYDTPRNSYAYL